MRVTRLYQNHRPCISMEFFPPRNEVAQAKFGSIVDTLAGCSPDYFSVTFGAGGSTREGSYQTVKLLQLDKQLPTVAYIAGYGLNPDDITDVLDGYQKMGVETIFVIRGDKPQDENFAPHPDSFSYASEIIAFIKKRYDFTLGCAGYPEGHIEAQSLDKDIDHLKEKVQNGADYVVCQYFYDNTFFFDYVKKCRAAGINVPIIPGIMPVYTIKMTQMLSGICGSTITDALQKRIDAVDARDKDVVLNLGVEFATEQCRGLLRQGVAGLHFYTMNRSKSTDDIINRLKTEKRL